jgi:hypothetical protein
MRSPSFLHWSAYPALLLACAFGAGVAIRASVVGGRMEWWAGGVGVGLLVFATAQWRGRGRLVSLAPLGRTVGVLFVALCAGGAGHAVYTTPSPRSVTAAASASSPVTLSGIVEDAPERSGVVTRFTLDVDSIRGPDAARAADGHVRITVRPSPWEERSPSSFPSLVQGDRVQVRGRLQSPGALTTRRILLGGASAVPCTWIHRGLWTAGARRPLALPGSSFPSDSMFDGRSLGTCQVPTAVPYYMHCFWETAAASQILSASGLPERA